MIPLMQWAGDEEQKAECEDGSLLRRAKLFVGSRNPRETLSKPTLRCPADYSAISFLRTDLRF